MKDMFNFLHKKAVDIYRKEIKNFIEKISKLDKKGQSDLLIHAVYTRAGLQNEGHIRNIDGTVNKKPYLDQYPIMLNQYKKLVGIFQKRGLGFQAASMSIWVHALRALINSELQEEMNRLWQILMKSSDHWKQSLQQLYEEDVEETDQKLVEDTMKLSRQILKNLPPKLK